MNNVLENIVRWALIYITGHLSKVDSLTKIVVMVCNDIKHNMWGLKYMQLIQWTHIYPKAGLVKLLHRATFMALKTLCAFVKTIKY